MKKYYFFLFLFFMDVCAEAAGKDSTIYYSLPDSVKAIQFMAEINVSALHTRKECQVGIRTDIVSLSLESDKNKRSVVFEFPTRATISAKGLNTEADEKGEIEWEYEWTPQQAYRLLIATAGDSAENFSLYSGYVWLPGENKWKLIGTCRVESRWSTLQNPAGYYSAGRKTAVAVNFNQAWCQRNTGSWKNMKGMDQPWPVINLFPHLDSLEQSQQDEKQIREAIELGKTDTKETALGVHYKITKEGTGRQVMVSDTVSVYYRLTLLSDGSLVDETKEKPASFPLQRLIKGWQIGLPLCKTGGKIRLVIPSGLAYSIRTRAAKIPPNSILVFEIEVVDAKPGS